MLQEQNLENFIKEVEALLLEIRNEQIALGLQVKQYHKVNMKKFAKLREFNEIADMTNQVFEKRISNIEQMLQKIAKSK